MARPVAPLTPAPRIAAATSATDLEEARALFREYFATSARDADFAVCLARHGPDAELAGLPGDYAPPRGRLLLARVDDGPAAVAGCVALRPTEEPGVAEMKRLYVRPAYRGRGVGRALVVAVLEEAARAGYGALVLDTLPSMVAAQALYRELGFATVAASASHPVAGALFMRRAL